MSGLHSKTLRYCCLGVNFIHQQETEYLLFFSLVFFLMSFLLYYYWLITNTIFMYDNWRLINFTHTVPSVSFISENISAENSKINLVCIFLLITPGYRKPSHRSATVAKILGCFKHSRCHRGRPHNAAGLSRGLLSYWQFKNNTSLPSLALLPAAAVMEINWTIIITFTGKSPLK